MTPVDPKCFELAKYFLEGAGGDEIDVKMLAASIQEAVEAFFVTFAVTKEPSK